MANFNDAASHTHFNTLTSSGAKGVTTLNSAAGTDGNAGDCLHFNSLSGINHNQHFNSLDNDTAAVATKFDAISGATSNLAKFSNDAPPVVEEHCRKRHLGY